MNNCVVFTSIIGTYDAPLRPSRGLADLPHVLFSDRPRRAKGWAVRVLPVDQPSLARFSRSIKVLIPEALRHEYDYSIYLDANRRLLAPIDDLRDEFERSRSAVGLFRHDARDSFVDELTACIRRDKLDDRDKARWLPQLDFYRAEGLGLEGKLFDTGVLFRSHRHQSHDPAMSLWWDQLDRFTKRDQLSLPYVLDKLDVDYHVFDELLQSPDARFRVYPHVNSRLSRVKRSVLYTLDSLGRRRMPSS